MIKYLGKYHSDVVEGAYCVVLFDFKEEVPLVEFYDDTEKLMRTEEYASHSLSYAKSAAINWCSGIKSY